VGAVIEAVSEEEYPTGDQGASVMIRNAIRVVAIVLATLAISVAVVTTAPSASATVGKLCEFYGNYCLGSVNTDLYTAVVARAPGRTISSEQLSGDFLGYHIYELHFSGDYSHCVGMKDDLSYVNIKPCSGGIGTVWARVPQSDGKSLWINRYATQQQGIGGYVQYLTGKNAVDERFFTARLGACCGDYQVFHWT